MNVYIVGHHTENTLSNDLTIVGQEAVTFALNKLDCDIQLAEVAQRAVTAGADMLLFQNIPGILAALLTHRATVPQSLVTRYGLRMGVIVSRPGGRRANVTMEYRFPFGVFSPVTRWEILSNIVKLLNHTNGRAHVEVHGDLPTDHEFTIAVTVDPVSEFVFDHIEDLY